MSSPILPIQDSHGSPTSIQLASVDRTDGEAFRSELRAGGRALEIQADLEDPRLSAGPDAPAPPSEVLEEIAAAGRTNEQLNATGRQVRFNRDEQSGRIAIELRGRDGDMQRHLSIAETLDLAAGKPLG